LEVLQSARYRRIFLIVIDHGVELAVYADAPADNRLSDLLSSVFANMLGEESDTPRRLTTSADCMVFDDAVTVLPEDVRIGAIPAPGLIFVIPRSVQSIEELELLNPDQEPNRVTSELNFHRVRLLAFHTVRLDETWGPRLYTFLEGPDTFFVPDPLPVFDAFISFTSVDFLQASELALALTEHGTRCFLANTSISAGSLWNDELRVALQSSRCLLLLASEASADSSWVLSEVGAAWILDIPILLVPTGESPESWQAFLHDPKVKIVARDAILDAPEFR
jgi:hypothetical protein